MYVYIVNESCMSCCVQSISAAIESGSLSLLYPLDVFDLTHADLYVFMQAQLIGCIVLVCFIWVDLCKTG